MDIRLESIGEVRLGNGRTIMLSKVPQIDSLKSLVFDEEEVQPQQSFTETSAPLLTFPTLIDTLRNFPLFISHIGKADISECIAERKPPEVNENRSEAPRLNFTIPPCRRKGSKCRSSTVTEKPNLQTTKSRKGLRN